MTSAGLRCTIVIPLFNKVEYTERCLEHIVRNTPDDLYEVVLVDNGSADATGDLLAMLDGDVTIIRNPENLGFSRACNQGAAAARTELILFLNNDTEPQPGWLEPMLQVVQREPGVGVVGSRLLFPDGTLQHAGVFVVEDYTGAVPFYAVHRFYQEPPDLPQANVCEDLQVVTGASMLVRRSAFYAAGGFDEGYWNGSEDVDLCFKIRELGWRVVYEPASLLIHHESVSGPERFRKADENIARLVKKWAGRVVPDVLVDIDGRVKAHPLATAR